MGGGPMLDDGNSPADELFTVLYDELHAQARRLMMRERAGHTLQATAVVNELYLTLSRQNRVAWQGQTHFKAVAALAMRRLLQEHARFAGRKKRGGGWNRITLHDAAATFTTDLNFDVELLDRALRRLAEFRDRTARVVEMKFFAGMSDEEIAEQLDTSARTVERDWRFARAWLLTELGAE
ncbi:MAG: sigma-70 family RNA polymerase sigma factor [Planctomycetes bacterium]|nr:sigma-70 family RNA polymerase sigma factor [Planctomycetota bacterium]